VVKKCGAFHALVFVTMDTGDFKLLSSHGSCDLPGGAFELEGVDSVAELRAAVAKVCQDRNYSFRALPLISDACLFGALVVVYPQSEPPNSRQWQLAEGLTELTAISLNKTYQHQKLQKAFDDLHASQDALVRTERLRALGEMSAGIAHDLKNILNPLLLYTDLTRDAAGDPAEIQAICERVEKILTRGLQTVERLRDFSRQSSEDNGSVCTDLNSLIHEAVEISRPKLTGIEVVLRLGTSPTVNVRPADCVTALLNLMFNAAEALNGKGKIIIESGCSDQESWVSVADNGPGIPADITNRILEPFFTTKGESGTGLGLSLVYAFTQRHGGRLHMESTPGQGTKFTMRFPMVRDHGGTES